MTADNPHFRQLKSLGAEYHAQSIPLKDFIGKFFSTLCVYEDALKRGTLWQDSYEQIIKSQAYSQSYTHGVNTGNKIIETPRVLTRDSLVSAQRIMTGERRYDHDGHRDFLMKDLDTGGVNNDPTIRNLVWITLAAQEPITRVRHILETYLFNKDGTIDTDRLARVENPERFLGAIILSPFKDSDYQDVKSQGLSFHRGLMNGLNPQVERESLDVYPENPLLALELWKSLLFLRTSAYANRKVKRMHSKTVGQIRIPIITHLVEKNILQARQYVIDEMISTPEAFSPYGRFRMGLPEELIHELQEERRTIQGEHTSAVLHCDALPPLSTILINQTPAVFLYTLPPAENTAQSIAVKINEEVQIVSLTGTIIEYVNPRIKHYKN